MYSCMIKCGLCNRLGNNFDICNKITDCRYYYTYWTKYIENADRLSRIIDRRKRVKQYVTDRKTEGYFGLQRVSYLLFGQKHPEGFAPDNIKRWVYYKGLNASLRIQSYNPEKTHKLGSDLAAAEFILRLKGKVRFQDFLHWTETVDYENLPKEYDSRYVITAIDASPIEFLRYEGLDNILGLTRLKWLSLNGCCYIDDWCLDRLSAEYPALEYLDISNCRMITERGLVSLYKMKNLKTLIVTNFDNSVTLELTCMLLEECIPGLTCKVCVPPPQPQEQ